MVVIHGLLCGFPHLLPQQVGHTLGPASLQQRSTVERMERGIARGHRKPQRRNGSAGCDRIREGGVQMRARSDSSSVQT